MTKLKVLCVIMLCGGDEQQRDLAISAVRASALPAGLARHLHLIDTADEVNARLVALADNYDDVHYRRHSFSGYASTRRFALSDAASTDMYDFYMFLDDDDVIHPHSIENAILHLEANPGILLGGTVTSSGSDHQVCSQSSDCLHAVETVGASLMSFEASLVDEVQSSLGTRFDKSGGEDTSVCIDFRDRGRRVLRAGCVQAVDSQRAEGHLNFKLLFHNAWLYSALQSQPHLSASRRRKFVRLMSSFRSILLGVFTREQLVVGLGGLVGLVMAEPPPRSWTNQRPENRGV